MKTPHATSLPSASQRATPTFNRRARSVVVASVLFCSLFAPFANYAYASAPARISAMHSGLVSLAAGQTVRLNVTLNPDLVALGQSIALTLSFDVYDASLIGTDGSAATVTRATNHLSARVTLRTGEAAFFEYTVPRDNVGQMVAASVGISNPDLKPGELVPAVMPTLEGRTATGQTIYVLPGAPCAFQEVDSRLAPNTP